MLTQSHLNMSTIERLSHPLSTCGRIAVAPVGSTVLDESGEEILIQKTSVGGIMSEGMLCDARMLGWVGGAEGIAAQIPDSFPLGSAPPATKPRTDAANSDVSSHQQLPAVDVQPLFEKKLTKEEKKKIADEKRKAKKLAKEAAVSTEN
jgi:tRNA-binding EMAP/Myf-like protein